MAKKESKEQTQWHDWLGTLFMETVTGLQIEVLHSFFVTTLSPKGDILLIRHATDFWSEAQRRYLPDGIRDCLASHIIIDLKYTESINADSFFQIGYYGSRYRKNQKLKRSKIQRFLLSSRTPQKSRLKRWGYQETDKAGVYRSTASLHELIPIISLNDLNREPHNAIVKCFAKDPEERKYALEQLGQFDMAQSFSPELSRFLSGLWTQWLLGANMDIQLTTEQVMKIGELWGDTFLHTVRPEEFLSRHKREEILSFYKPEEILSGYKPEEVLSRYKPEEVLSHYKPEEVLSRYKPEEIEAYLAKLKHQSGANGA